MVTDGGGEGRAGPCRGAGGPHRTLGARRLWLPVSPTSVQAACEGGAACPGGAGPDPPPSPSPPTGSPGPPRDVSVTKSASELTLQWSEGHAGRAPTTGYVIEGRPSGKRGGGSDVPGREA